MRPILLLAAVLPVAAFAQTAPANQQAVQQQQGQQQQAQAAPDPCQQLQPKGSPFVKDVANVGVSQGGAIAGAAVAGPVGAVIGSVGLQHATNAVKKATTSKKKKRQQQALAQACDQQQAQAQQQEQPQQR